MSRIMRAAVCVRAGDPEVMEIRELPVPPVRERWSLGAGQGRGLELIGTQDPSGTLAERYVPARAWDRMCGDRGSVDRSDVAAWDDSCGCDG